LIAGIEERLIAGIEERALSRHSLHFSKFWQ